MNKKIIIIIIIIVTVVGGVIIVRSGGEESSQDDSRKIGNRVGDIAPDFTTVDYEGNEVKLSDFAGQPILVNFWASWCLFCVGELPLMARIQ